MKLSNIAVAFSGLSLAISGPAAATTQVAAAPSRATESGFQTPLKPASATIGKPLQLAEHCDDNWWEFSLWQALACAYKKAGQD